MTRVSTLEEILRILSKIFIDKNPKELYLLHDFSLFLHNFVPFHIFSHIFTKIQQFQKKKYSGHTTPKWLVGGAELQYLLPCRIRDFTRLFDPIVSSKIRVSTGLHFSFSSFFSHHSVQYDFECL